MTLGRHLPILVVDWVIALCYKQVIIESEKA